MIIVFVIDTSASMNQRTGTGLTLLDIAKSAVEYFLKIRGRDIQAIRNDRFFLVTYDDGPSAVRAGWKDSFATFMQELKNLTAKDLSLAGPALKRAFDLLNQFRLQTGIDNYGQGRNPWFIEPAVILHITDGGQLTTLQGIADTLTLPLTTQPGSELTIEPFRWDQRVFSLVLQFAGNNAPPSIDPNPNSAAMCEVTGGKCITVTSMKTVFQAIESIANRNVQQIGVVMNFEFSPRLAHSLANTSPSTAPSLQTMLNNMPSGLHRLMYVRPNSLGHWPLPEAFLPDQAMTQLPPRTAHPVVWFVPHEGEPNIAENFPFDKYELEAGPFTQHLLHHTRPGTSWTVLMPGSNGSGGNALEQNGGEPFGFLKTSAGGGGVSLIVLPYAFPKLWALLDELSVVHKMIPNAKWRSEFDRYVSSIPPYYIPPLRTALKRWGGPLNLIPDHLDGSLNYTISSYLRKLKQQSKAETDRIMSSAQQKQKEAPATPPPPAVIPMNLTSLTGGSPKPKSGGGTASSARSFHQTLDRSSGAHHDHFETEADLENAASNAFSIGGGAFNYSGLMIEEASTVASTPSTSSTIRNAFDINRSDLLSQLDRLRSHMFSNGQQADDQDDVRHSVPVSQMGNYHELLKKREILREIDEDDERKAKMPLFGNPFVRADKIAARLNAAAAAYGGIGAVDEAVEGDVSLTSGGGGGGSAIGGGSAQKTSLLKRPRSPSPRPPQIGGALPQQQLATQKRIATPPPSKPAAPLASPASNTGGGAGGIMMSAAAAATASSTIPTPTPLPSPPLSRISIQQLPPSSAKLAGGPTAPTLTEYVDPNASMPAEPPQRASQPIPLRTLLVPSASSQQQQPVLVPSAVKTVLGSVGAISTQQQSAQQQSLASEAEVKAAILRELRKPGKNYQELFRMLASLKMTTLEKKAYIQELKIQAQTFKKASLIQELENYEKSLVG